MQLFGIKSIKKKLTPQIIYLCFIVKNGLLHGDCGPSDFLFITKRIKKLNKVITN